METIINKLDPEFKAKWVAALRSGEYKQGTHNLFNTKDNSFCCLGVACVVVGYSVDSIKTRSYIYEDEHLCDTPKVIQGCPSENSVVKSLTHMNDGHLTPQKSFSEIADWIEANL